ncbi:MAG TPA: hypothetical protein VFB79_06725 [Candidatus Angelobacter sp.]|nr:hypothetical protein [Candidatus Angelobacter sp.]
MINRQGVTVGTDVMETVQMADGMKREVVAFGGPDAADATNIIEPLATNPVGTEAAMPVREARQRRIKNVFPALNADGPSDAFDVSSVSPKAHTVAVNPANATSYTYELQGAVDANWFSLSGPQQSNDGSPHMVSVDGRCVDQVRINVIDLQGNGASLVPTYLGVA